jgi:UDP-2,4-diacetamido-2,4,6-trideoxy-beta-L-altropyranose hydrolase
MRCLALAQAWQDSGGQVVFVMADSTAAIEERLKLENAEVVRIAMLPGGLADAECLADLARRYGAEWVVADGYHLGADYQSALKKENCKLLVLDDHGHAGKYVADLVLNQNAFASERFYVDRSPQTRLLLGSHYVLLRREFRAWQGWRRAIAPVASRILVTFGGSDPKDVTSRVLQALNEATGKDLDVVVVVGGSNPHLESLNRLTATARNRVRLAGNAANMAELMAWADVAIAGAGATCWELCLLGLPAILVDSAPNQLPIAQELHRRGAAIHAGSASGLTPSNLVETLHAVLWSVEDRSNMSRVGRQMVDGSGAARVAAILQGRQKSPLSRDGNSAKSKLTSRPIA